MKTTPDFMRPAKVIQTLCHNRDIRHPFALCSNEYIFNFL